MCDRVLHIPACKAFLLFKHLKERFSIVAIDFYLLETWELCAEVELTELMDALVCAWCLLSELVAGEVEDLETLGVKFLVELLEFVVLRGETTLCGGIHDEQHFVGVLLEGYVLAFSVLDREFINSLHCLYIKYMCRFVGTNILNK